MLVHWWHSSTKTSPRTLAAAPRLPCSRSPSSQPGSLSPEAMYLVYQIGGWPLQRNVWRYVAEGTLQIHPSAAAEQERMRQLMEQYRDTLMDLADASLVATAAVLKW
jgi:hypothetical protein